MNRFWRLAQMRLSRRALFTGAAAVVASGFAGKWLADRLAAPGSETLEGGNLTPAGPAFIDARELKKTMSVEQLNATAEQYFARAPNWDFFLTKPLAQIEGAPPLLHNVAHLLKGLQILPGMSVLDFGAGSCWLSRWLTQMGMEVIALDVSETALKIGQALYARLPIIGDKPPPRFLHFDGHRIGLPDASVDRILCLDVFHHLPNPDEVLAQMCRILKPGGIAGFCEPGPNHSRSPGAQFEMRYFKVLEDDVDIHRIWDSARQAGFTRIRLAVVNSQPFMLTLPEFDDYLGGGKPSEMFAEVTRAAMLERRIFFMQKGSQPLPSDSRSRAGLAAKLQVTLGSATVKEDASLTARVVATNSGSATWLPHSTHGSRRGAVWLGCHLLDASAGMVVSHAFYHHPLSDERAIAPGEAVTLDVRIPAPSKGRYILEFDLVSESVGWFAMGGSETARVKIQVT